MATNMPPHNLVEVIGAARHLLDHPDATLDDLMRFVPGPDLPGGGRIVGLEGIREAYATGRGTFRTRATARVDSITPRRRGIVVTEQPYLVGPEKVIEKIKDLVQGKRLQGISDVKDLTDRKHGLRPVSYTHLDVYKRQVLRTPAQRAAFWEHATPPTADGPPDRWLTGMQTAPVLIVCLSDPGTYLDRYAAPDKGWTDRDPARWPVPYCCLLYTSRCV